MTKYKTLIINNLLQKWVPSVFLTTYQKYWKKSGWFGNYPSWEAAEKDCDGYDNAAILARVVEATRQVRDGKAAFERDSVLFFDEELDEQLLTILTKIKDNLSENTPLIVLDFGGALGSTYWQNRRILSDWHLKWIVVEQKHFVEIGQTEMENEQLKFAFSIEDVCKSETPNIVLFNSVLQYVETPYAFIEAVENQEISHVFIGRTPSFEGAKDRIMQQIVPPKIYKASYPSWVFSLDSFKNKLNTQYTIKSELNTPYGHHQIDGKQLFLTDLFLELEK
jgi:putative methyltransferase (TIGR04325 family)